MGAGALRRAGRPALAAAILFLAVPCAAQSRDVQFGPRLSVSDDADLGIGADLRWRFLPDDRRLALSVSFDYFFPQDDGQDFEDALGNFADLFDELDLPFDFDQQTELEYWEANLNLTWDFGSGGSVVPYAGVGVNYANAKASVLGFETEDSDVGANVLAGLRIARRFYVEAKREAGGGELFVLTAGVRF